MGGSRYSGMITISELNRAKFGGAKPVNTDHLTLDAVNWALKNTVNNNPNNVNASSQEVAKAVGNYLDRNGFEDVRSNKASVVDEEGNKFYFKLDRNNRLWIARKV